MTLVRATNPNQLGKVMEKKKRHSSASLQKRAKEEREELHRTRGRPPSDFNDQHFEDLCRLQCTQEEMAGFLKLDYDVLKKRVEEYYGMPYKKVYEQYSSVGKVSLRRAQYKKAVHDEDTRMLTWLGMQYLGQKNHSDNTYAAAKPIELKYRLEELDATPEPKQIEQSDEIIEAEVQEITDNSEQEK